MGSIVSKKQATQTKTVKLIITKSCYSNLIIYKERHPLEAFCLLSRCFSYFFFTIIHNNWDLCCRPHNALFMLFTLFAFLLFQSHCSKPHWDSLISETIFTGGLLVWFRSLVPLTQRPPCLFSSLAGSPALSVFA